MILQHAEHSQRAHNTITAESTSYRDSISVCPQRAAGITMVNFTVLPGPLSAGEYGGVGETHSPLYPQGNHIIFQSAIEEQVNYSEICKSTTTNPCDLV